MVTIITAVFLANLRASEISEIGHQLGETRRKSLILKTKQQYWTVGAALKTAATCSSVGASNGKITRRGLVSRPPDRYSENCRVNSSIWEK
jgi:hypothetical protein